MIIRPQTITPKMGTSGTKGVRNGRGIVGSDFLNNMIPIHTKTKAKRVPIDVRSPAQLSGKNPPKIETNKNKIRFDLCGVRNLL